PPLAVGVDPYVLATRTGNVLIVLRAGVSDLDMAAAKLDVLDTLPVRVLGAVLNDDRPYGAYRYYTYDPAAYAAANGAASRLRSELQSYLVQQLSQYLRSPAVRARALVRVSVQGGVVRPGYYAVPADALVADALMAAGGTLPTSKPGKMRLERGGERFLQGKE